MPHRTLILHEVADYLHLSRADVEELVRRSEIPFARQGERLVFRRSEIDAWASQRIIGFTSTRLKEFHKKSSAKVHSLAKEHAIICELLKRDYIAPALTSRTKASLLSDMVKLAENTGLVLLPKDLLVSLQEREQMCSTALAGGIALLHPRFHQPYMFEDSFIVMGRTVHELPFGSPDGLMTDIFFLICCQDDRIHLHVLARLCILCYQTSLLLELREAKTPDKMMKLIRDAETEVIKHL